MADSLTSQSDHIHKPPILELGLLESKDHGSSSSIDGVEELEFGESIERELLELAIAQAVIENSIYVGHLENKEAVDVVEDSSTTGTREQVAQQKNGGEGIVDEGEVMKVGVVGGGGQHRDHSKRAIYPMRPDAEDCAYYMKFGSCKFGHSCKFNHPPRKKNQVSVV